VNTTPTRQSLSSNFATFRFPYDLYNQIDDIGSSQCNLELHNRQWLVKGLRGLNLLLVVVACMQSFLLDMFSGSSREAKKQGNLDYSKLVVRVIPPI
jgi:hypothetical protein